MMNSVVPSCPKVEGHREQDSPVFLCALCGEPFATLLQCIRGLLSSFLDIVTHSFGTLLHGAASFVGGLLGVLSGGFCTLLGIFSCRLGTFLGVFGRCLYALFGFFRRVLGHGFGGVSRFLDRLLGVFGRGLGTLLRVFGCRLGCAFHLAAG